MSVKNNAPVYSIFIIIVILSLLTLAGTASAMFCSKCGKQIGDNSNFCKFCGVKTDAEAPKSIVNKDELNRTLLEASSKGDIAKVREAVSAGADIETMDKNGDTALEHAADKGGIDIVKFLVESGAKIDSYNVDGWTPLMSACNRGYFEVAKYLIEKKASVNAEARLGKKGTYTPLMLASQNGHFEIVRFLVERGADVKYMNGKNITALKLANEKKHEKIVSFLKAAGASEDTTGLTEDEAVKILSKYCMKKYGSDSCFEVDRTEEKDGRNYYVVRAHGEWKIDPKTGDQYGGGTWGWFYVDRKSGKIYNWNLADDRLEEL